MSEVSAAAREARPEEVEDDEVAPHRRALAVPVPVSAPDAGERSGR